MSTRSNATAGRESQAPAGATSHRTGVILMTYGSATTAEHVADYFTRIYGGKASPALISDFENRYRLVGHSPLIGITKKQAAALQERLGTAYVVRAGMRHSAPSIDDAVKECRAEGAATLIGIILSPQFSSFIMDGYQAAFNAAATAHGFDASSARIAAPWPTEAAFITLLAQRVSASLESLQKIYGTQDSAALPVVFTTHSLPMRVVEQDPSYLDQLAATTSAIRAQLDPNLEWHAGYQSAGHTPEAWLTPDLTDILAQLSAKKAPAVLIVPIQFLSDHLEVLYDLDIAAKKQCEVFDIAYHRIELPNTDPLFITALAEIVKKH